MANQSIAKQLPLKVNELSSYVSNLQENGWAVNGDFIFQNFFEELSMLAKEKGDSAIESLINELIDLCKPCMQTQASPLSVQTLNKIQMVIHQLQNTIAASFFNKKNLTTLRPILLIGLKNKKLCQEIIKQIKYFDYHCIPCKTLNDIIEIAKTSEGISAIILDTQYCTAHDLARLKAISSKIAIFFISKKEDITTRLFSAKAGGCAYLTYPLEFTTLLEKIDQAVIPPSENIPYRILIIEDSRTQARIISQQLRQAKMITYVLADPLEIYHVLMEFQPDLILLDLYMPICSGTELAKVIRQFDAFVSIPIVYLSIEEDATKQFNALQEGGDSFITKSTLQDHLVAIVTKRAQRYRTLHAVMIQDSLTGLLNHTRILEQLDLEIARAKRNNHFLSFVMIDIDNFKTVNDSYGHPIGDKVIKGLAQLLKQRLRKIDSVGRYGGEEFAIILPQTQSIAVFQKLEQIRQDFSKLVHHTYDPKIDFTATFSGGLAELNKKNNTVDKLVRAADQALYLAKEQGHNKIIISDAG